MLDNSFVCDMLLSQVVRHLSIRRKHNGVYACHGDVGLHSGKWADQMGSNPTLFPVTCDSCLTFMPRFVYLIHSI